MYKEKHATTKKAMANIFTDEGEFKFPNGDKYVGQYQATKKGRTIKKEGRGCYTTWDGQVYSGIWKNDQLVPSEDCEIIFADGSIFVGYVKDMAFYKHGMYKFPDGSVLTSSFESNTAVGDINLVDSDNQEWIGEVENGIIRLLKIHKFYKLCPSKSK